MKPSHPKIKEHCQRLAEEIEQLFKKGLRPWIAPWSEKTWRVAKSMASKRPYRGGNLLALNTRGWTFDYDSPWWGTFRAVKKLGGAVMKGEKGTGILYWKPAVFAEEKREDGTVGVVMKRPVTVRYYTVFNANQCKGLTLPGEEETEPCPPTGVAKSIIETADRLGVDYHLGGNGCGYSFRDDRVNMVHPDRFKDPNRFAQTFLHEIGHWTGHESRLNRRTLMNQVTEGYGGPSYCKEEVRAEMAAYLTCRAMGFTPALDSSATYIGHWLRSMESDGSEIYRAAADAEAITNYIMKEGGHE